MRERRASNIRFLGELNEEYLGKEPIFIKGVTAYLLTQDENLLKKSSDIDLFGEDILSLEQKLFSFGFEMRNKACDQHEFSKICNRKKNIYIELHRYFPMFYLNEACIKKYTILNVTKIEYMDLWKESEIINWQGRKIRVLKPEMAVLISCAHIFKGYVWQPYEKNTFRVQELLEIYSIVNNTDFSDQKYVELCDKYNGWDASSFCKEVLETIYKDKNPFSFISKSFRPIFKLTNDAGGIFKEYHGEDYFSKLLTNCVFDFVSTEMPNTLIVGKYNISQLEYIDCGKNKRKGEFELSFDIRKQEVEFRIFVKDLFVDGDNILIQLNRIHFHFFMYKDNNKNKVFGDAYTAK